MKNLQFRVLYREFLFRIVDLELLSKHAEGDSRTLLGQFASLLLFCSVILAVGAGIWAANIRDHRVPPLVQLTSAWTMQHFLIATTMLVVGLFAVLSWESTFPDRRDVMVLGHLPIRGRTLFLAKVAAVASALGLTLATLHLLAGIAWPLALAQFNSAPAPALVFDAALPPVPIAEFPSVMQRDIAPMLRSLDFAATDGGAGIVIGVFRHGERRIMNYGAAKPDSLFEIGSITKTFTGLLLAQIAVQGRLDIRDPVRYLLPPTGATAPTGAEITLLDLATHHSGLPRMPDNTVPGDAHEIYTNYHASDLHDFIQRHGLGKPLNTDFLYSNLGFAVLGAALANHARTSYPELLQREITGPLAMNDTVITLSPEQLCRLMQGHDYRRLPTPRWDLDAFASAGGIRSTAADMLTYLEAQLHPEKTPFRAALVASHLLRNYVVGDLRVALAWLYDPDTGVYEHGGGTGGFTSFAFFDPRRDFAAVGFMNAAPVNFPFMEVLSEHVRQRLSGEPALSLAPVSVPPAGPIRSFVAYWIAMLASGIFMFCCVLGLQGLAAHFLPRRWFLRVSAFLQLAVFCLLVCSYFLQRSPLTVLVAGPRQPWISWIPSYWFVGLYQQLSGSLHPALSPFARRAWIGLIAAICATAIAYAVSYLRSLSRIVEEPDIAPVFESQWLPRFGGLFETAIVQFSIRSLLRSRRHRMIFAFYLGVSLAFAILFLNAPRELSGPTSTDIWHQPSVPLLASTIMLMGFWVVGARVVFALPLDLEANWIFRAMPFRAGPACLRARRRSLFMVAVLPPWMISAAFLSPLWPWRAAAAHLAVLAFLGIILAEFTFDGVQRIPFTCSYLPGKSKLYLTFWLWIFLIVTLITGAAVNEREALQSAAATGAVLAGLGTVAVLCMLRNNWLASDENTELRFEEIPPDQLVSLNVS
ncbi:MAG: beta-lactamase family protein [Acidobacteriaceae bacterium]|nr:beta-lactamase family protein [Acidobacteriaceae bacterium]MBV9764465.1 beta-lactamase family protein [Acidobacteriaceae bacterium]